MAERLRRVLVEFRRRFGFGRAVAAPQIGLASRMLAVELPGWPPIVVNPEVVRRERETMTLWDDCMSFPELLVRVRRYANVTVAFETLDGKHHVRTLDVATSELLQHEIDHLDGILAIDRAEGSDSLVRRAAFAAAREYFEKQVDWVPSRVAR
jgi:peptide deformylase